MISLDHCILLGTLTKTHGIRGNVALRLKYVGFENILHMESVFIIIDNLPVPFFIEEYEHIHADEISLHLEDIETPEKALELVGYDVWLAASSVRPEESDRMVSAIPPLIGYQVIDQELGPVGTLNQVIDFKQNPLLQILNKSKEILIPLQKEFVIDIDDKQKTIHIKTPKGLIDIN